MSTPDSFMPVSDDLLDRYVAGACSGAEVRAVQQWLGAHPTMGRVVAVLRDGAAPPEAFSADTDWQRVAAEMTIAPVRRPLSLGATVSPRRAGRSRMRAAFIGGLTLAALAAVLWIPRVVHKPGARPVTTTATYVTRAGERATVTLPEGVRVVLAPASRMDVRGRTITLRGQALFSAAHSAESPLTVMTATSRTVVLGTTFMVRAYDDGSEVRVVVAEGRVQLSARDSASSSSRVPPSLVLAVGDAGHVADGRVSMLSAVDLGAALGWAQGKLVFEQAALPDVVRDLSRTYDLDIRLASPALAKRRITATFVSPDATAVLDELMLVLGARYERHGPQGRIVTIVTNS